MKSGTKLFLVVLWLAVLGGGAFVWLYYLRGDPADTVASEFRAAYEQAVEEGNSSPNSAEFAKRVNKSNRPTLEKKLEEIKQEMEGRYSRIPFAIDNFSGYSVFRSKEFHKRLKSMDTYLGLVNDNADYDQRIKTMEKGEIKMGVYTIDALLNTSILCGQPPATIVMVVDESKGADAVLAFRDSIPTLSEMNKDDVKFVFTKGSPSETLARVVKGSFPSSKITTSNMMGVESPHAVMKQIDEASKAKDKTKDRKAFVLWEPDVSKMKAKYPDQLVTLFDSKNEKSMGKIVDVLVVENKFLKENPKIVEAVVRAYLETFEEYKKKGLVSLVMADAEKTNAPMTQDEAKSVVENIAWRGAEDNYAYFGLKQGQVRNVEKMVQELNEDLIKAGVYSRIKEPTHGDPKSLVSAVALQEISKGPVIKEDKVTLTKLTKDEIKRMLPVNDVVIKQIDFKPSATEANLALAGDALEQAKEVVLNNPKYYLEVRGSALAGTNPEEALRIAQARAEWVAKQLQEMGVPEIRVVATSNDNMTGDTNKRAVEFFLLEKPNK